MTTYRCRTCDRSWSMGPTRDMKLGELCHECAKASIHIATEALEFVSTEHPSEQAPPPEGGPWALKGVLDAKATAARSALNLIRGHAPERVQV